jgi:hypothetical protein
LIVENLPPGTVEFFLGRSPRVDDKSPEDEFPLEVKTSTTEIRLEIAYNV